MMRAALRTSPPVPSRTPLVRQQEIEAGQQRQEQIRELLRAFGKATKEKLFKDRKVFLTELRRSTVNVMCA